MGKITLYEDKIIFERKDELTVIEAYGENCLRCRSTKNAKLSDETWTLLPPKTEPQCVVSGDEKEAIITNGMVSAKIEAGNIWYGGIISYFRNGKQILHTKFEGDYTTRNVHREGNHYQVKVIFDANKGEHFYGLGQEQREIYLPEGNWIHVFDRKTYIGGQVIMCHAKLHEFIAFVKEGSDAIKIFDI